MQGVGTPPPSWAARDSSGPTLLLHVLLLVQNKFCEVSGQLDSVWFSVAIEACGCETPDLGYVLGVSVYIRGFGVENKSGGSPGCPRGREARPHPRGQPGTLLAQLF